MVAYSFHPRFVEPIRQGYKCQTIRGPRLRHARPGELIQLYSGLRTARAAKIMADPHCLEVMPVSIAFRPDGAIERIMAGGHPALDLDAFALRDGFRDADEMAAFWRAQHGMLFRFDGVLIEWAPPRELMGVAA
jgi:hypothetical protein